MKRIISFDLDGTLVHGAYGDLVWNHGIPQEYAKRYQIPFEEAKAMIRKEYEAVGDGEVIWYNIEVWLERFKLPVSPEDLLERYETHIELMPHAREVLEFLEKKYTLVIASNAARIFVEKETETAGIVGYFDHIISAATDYGILKKEEAFFHRLLATLGAGPEEMVHVGDHALFDYEVPTSLGIESYHLSQKAVLAGRKEKETNGGGVITSLKELLGRL